LTPWTFSRLVIILALPDSRSQHHHPHHIHTLSLSLHPLGEIDINIFFEICRITFGPNEISLPSQERLFVTYMYTCMYVISIHRYSRTVLFCMYVCTVCTYVRTYAKYVTQVYECVTIYSKGDLVIRREKSMSQPMLQRAASLSLPRAASMRRTRAGSQDSGELEVTPRSVRTIRNNSLICHL